MRGRGTILVASALLGIVSGSSGVKRLPTIIMPANKTADRIALVVANTNYPDAEAPLPHIRADEAALADALREKGYDVELVADATREQLLQAVNAAEAKMRRGSTFVLSFAGYAVQSKGQNYLLPVDAKIWTERDVRVQGLSGRRITIGAGTHRRTRTDRITRCIFEIRSSAGSEAIRMDLLPC
jgi:hypothetical protein